MLLLEILPLDWSGMAENSFRMSIALAIPLLVGFNRERESHSAGIRTFPLVAVASCGFIIMARDVFTSDDSVARVLSGVATGIGFIGGGAILKGKTEVHGTATAASIWLTGAIGAAVGFDRYEIAIVLGLMNYGILRIAGPFKESVANGKADSED